MNKHKEVKNGNSIPVHAPRIAENSVNPYGCKNMKAVVVYCKGDKDILDKYFSITPFTCISDIFAIVFSDFENYDGIEGAYKTVSIIVPAEHKGLKGGYHLFTYNNNSDVIIRNREVFGYPDKFANIKMDDTGDHIMCTCHIRCTGALNGKKLIQVEVDKKNASDNTLDVPDLTPDILLKTMGNPEGEGLLYELALCRNEMADFKNTSESDVKASVQLYGSEVDPLDEFQPKEIIGAKYIVGDFVSTNENGWAQIREEVYSIDDYFKNHNTKY